MRLLLSSRSFPGDCEDLRSPKMSFARDGGFSVSSFTSAPYNTSRLNKGRLRGLFLQKVVG
jgi:hypothetical protein